MPYDKDGKYFRKPVLKEDSESNKEKLLSERKRGYLIAILFGTFGLPLGWITSPLVLYVLNKKLKEKNGKVPNRFLRWALIGIIGAPLSFAPIFLIPDEALKTSAEKGFVSKIKFGRFTPLLLERLPPTKTFVFNISFFLDNTFNFILPSSINIMEFVVIDL